jgi:hypothetical protein
MRIRQKISPRTRKVILGGLLFLLAGYALFAAFMWRTMRGSPEDFGRVMARLPQPAVFLVFPFETLWMRARAGTLSVGDPAPDFLLTKLDKSGPVHLAELNAKQPVVLVFGSYT